MADVFTKSKRSQVMARIKGRGNKDTELALMKLLRRHHITGWRRHVEIRGRAVLPGGPEFRAAQQRPPVFRVRPDFVFPKLKLAVFVDGCFWHACPKHATQPKGNAAFWKKKLAANKARDCRVNQTLRKAGWRVVRVWEHELRRDNETRLARRMIKRIRPASR